MDKKKIIEIGIVCVLFLVMAGYVEKTEHSVDTGSRVIRASKRFRVEGRCGRRMGRSGF